MMLTSGKLSVPMSPAMTDASATTANKGCDVGGVLQLVSPVCYVLQLLDHHLYGR